MSAEGRFIVSLDFELLWGVLDKEWRESYRSVVLTGRKAVPEMLKLFERRGVRATWACVGLALCSGRDEALERLGPLAERPASVGLTLGEYVARNTGKDESVDPAHFAPSLAARIASVPGQEIGSHTFSHYACLEAGSTPEGFREDLRAFRRLALDRGYKIESVVLPRNQVRADYLPVLAQEGIRAYRGTPPGAGLDEARAEERQSLALRALRLIEAYVPAPRRLGRSPNFTEPGLPVNVPAGRFLRPCLSGSSALEGLRIAKIEAEMTRAARAGSDYHLWWHPHNLGTRTELAMALLARILRRYARLRDEYGFRSVTMGEAAAEARARTPS